VLLFTGDVSRRLHAVHDGLSWSIVFDTVRHLMYSRHVQAHQPFEGMLPLVAHKYHILLRFFRSNGKKGQLHLPKVRLITARATHTDVDEK
jgi:hypothetical protein